MSNKNILASMFPLIPFLVVVLAIVGCAEDPSFTSSSTFTSSSPASAGSELAAVLKKVNGQLLQIGDNTIIIVPTDSCFELGTTHFTDNCPPVLQSVVNFIAPYGNTFITVTGYTDNVAAAEQAHLLTRAQ